MKSRSKATFPRGNFNPLTICKVIEDGEQFYIPHGLITLIKTRHHGSVKQFIEHLLHNIENTSGIHQPSPHRPRLLGPPPKPKT